jgi:cell division protein SepF
MNQRNRRPATRLPERAPVPSAVRVIGPEHVAGAVGVPERTIDPAPHDGAVVARPERFEELTSVVDHLRAGRAVALELDGLEDAAARRRGLAFVSGAAYALDVSVARGGTDTDALLLDPAAPEDDGDGDGEGQGEGAPRSVAQTPSKSATCVLCDLRIADWKFEPPLEMVVKRDGSRIWSPPAMVCSHCRDTIRHWKFALAWCSECERWGRRSVVSPCGRLYG